MFYLEMQTEQLLRKIDFVTSETRIYVFAFTDIRLAGSGLSREGRLEVKVGGIWGTVCDDIFHDVDAGVACASLGFG